MTFAALIDASVLTHESRGDRDGGWPFFGFVLLVVAVGAGGASSRAIRRHCHQLVIVESR